MKDVFLIVAMLINLNGDVEPRQHPNYAFDTLEECQAFVRLNYIGLYQGLDNQLAVEGYTQKIMDIGCGKVEPYEGDNPYQEDMPEVKSKGTAAWQTG